MFVFKTTCTLNKCKYKIYPQTSQFSLAANTFYSLCFISSCLISLQVFLLPHCFACTVIATVCAQISSKIPFVFGFSQPCTAWLLPSSVIRLPLFSLFAVPFVLLLPLFFPLIFDAKYLYKSQLPVEIIYTPIIAPALSCTMGAVVVEVGVSLISKLSGLFCFR